MTPTSPAEIPFEESIWVHSLHPHMLIQDFENTVVPYRRHGEAYKLTVKGLPKGMVDDALELSRSGDGVDNFIRAVASTLLMEHEAWLEILVNDPDKEGLPFRVFLVTGVRQTQTGNWTRDPGRPDGPAFRALTQNERSNHPIETDPERLVRVHLPEEYPSGVLTEVIQGLVEADSISRHRTRREIELLSEQAINSSPVYPIESFRTERLRVAQVALPIGWTARAIFSKDSPFTEYFYYWRELRFLHFGTSMRKRAEEALCQLLDIAGTRCGFEASVTSSGMYAPTEVENLIKRFEEGDIPFSELSYILREMTETFPAQAREICNR